MADRAAVFGWRLAGDHIPERQQECWVVTRESPGMVDMALYSPGAYGSPRRTYNARSYEYPGEVVYWQPLAAPCPPDDVTGEVERLRAENANLKRLLDDANERAAQIEDWQIKCALLEVDRDKARAENAALAGERDRLREHIAAALGEPFRHEDGGIKEETHD